MVALLWDLLFRADGSLRRPRELLWLARGWWTADVALLERAGASSRLLAGPREHLVDTLLEQRRHDDAAEVARALSEAPWTWLAARALRAGRPERAVPPARRALELAGPDLARGVDAAAVLALALQGTGQEEPARDVVHQGLAALDALPPTGVRPAHEGLLWLAAAQAHPTGSDVGITAYRRALEASAAADRPAVAVALAHALHAAGDHGEAARVLEERTQQAEPGPRIEALRLLARLYLAHLDRPADGVSVLEEAVGLVGDAHPSPEVQAALHLELAKAALETREPARAALAAQEVLALADGATPLQLTLADQRLGLALEAVGDLEGASRALQAALGRCRDACIQFGGDAVPEALEVEVTRDLRRVFSAYSASAGALSGKVAEGTSR